ncbi:MAG: hypothetical protein M3Z85_05545 [Acidobacteriota bacterium]|nr:hypothetical protein [Acidobacteriota bacterium]
MSKFKPARPKTAKTPQVRAGLPCVVLVILTMIFVMGLLFLVMKNAS